MNQKESILNYLGNCYSNAKESDDVELMRRLTRAIIAFNCDKFDENLSWKEMMEEYMFGE